MDGLIAYALAKKYADQVGQSVLDAGFKVQVEQDRSILNQTGEQMTLYLLPKESSLSSDTYDEYVYTNKWEQVGSTDIELDYNDLENKPSINNIELSGNKTPTELDIDDYTKLRNLPTAHLYNRTANRYDPIELKHIWFECGDFHYYAPSPTSSPHLCIFPRYFAVLPYEETLPLDFDNINETAYRTGALWLKGTGRVTNFPAALSEIDRTQDYCVIHYFDGNNTAVQGKWFTRKVAGKTTSGKYVEYAQMVKVKFPYEPAPVLTARVLAETPWQKVSGGSQLTSGVVNQNGTITFTNSDGNTFTTTGASVIGPQGPQGPQGATGSQGPKGDTGATGPQGPQGDDYVLTAQDKTDIANIVLGELPTTQGVLYGNASN